MNFVNQSANFLLEMLNNVVWSAFIYAIISGIVAFVLGVILVRRMKKAGTHHRPYKWWQFLVRITYFFIPVSLLFVGAIEGGVWGAHAAFNQSIDEATKPVVDHFARSIPEIQYFLNHYVMPEGSTADEIVKEYNRVMRPESQGLVSNLYSTAMLKGAIELSPISDFASPVERVLALDLNQLKAEDALIIPDVLKGALIWKFGFLYWMFLSPFLIFYAVISGEFMLYKLLFRGKAPISKAEYSPSMQVA